MRHVPHQLAGLELWRDELSVRAFHELEMKKSVLHLDGVVFRCREPVCASPPEVGAVAPLRFVQPVSIKFVMPDELELLATRQQDGTFGL